MKENIKSEQPPDLEKRQEVMDKSDVKIPAVVAHLV